MRLNRSLFLTAALAASGLAFLVATPKTASAWPPVLAEWQTIYPSSNSDDNVAAMHTGNACGLCHFNEFGGTGWNPYGWEIRKTAFADGDSFPYHNTILKVALRDSELNPKSWSNLVEINNDTQPGWTAGSVNIYYDDTVPGGMGGQPPLSVAGTHDPLASPMVPLCDPGVGGVIGCPCGNPSGGNNRGCNNSSATFGAAITATGTASISGDTLLFTTAGEKPTAFSLLLQGPALNAGGAVYGQGIRCFNGPFKRLYSRAASGGSVVLPNFPGGDAPVHTRSAALGDTISPGQSRWYLIYYRDPNVLGGCPAASTFNATNTGRVDWGA